MDIGSDQNLLLTSLNLKVSRTHHSSKIALVTFLQKTRLYSSDRLNAANTFTTSSWKQTRRSSKAGNNDHAILPVLRKEIESATCRQTEVKKNFLVTEWTGRILIEEQDRPLI